MSTLSVGDPSPIRLELRYVLSSSGIDDYVAETAAEPPPYFGLDIDFSDLTVDMRKQAYRIYLRMHEEMSTTESDFSWETEAPPHERYPQLDRPTSQASLVIAAWESWYAAQDAAVARAEQARRTELAVEEGKRMAFRVEMARWIREQGSERLKLGLGRDYKVATGYVRERAAIEFPGFVLDSGSKAKWRDRANPSLKALKLETYALDRQKSIASFYKIRIVWLTKDEDGDDAKREAVVVPEYLNLYTLLGDPENQFDPDEIPF